jgi:hypothetical protein
MTKAQILGALDIETEDVDLSHIPGWGTVRIKDLTAGERDKLEQAIVYERTEMVNGKAVKRQAMRENVRATFVAACLVDENLQPVFTKGDVTELGKKSARALDAIFTIIRRRNGISQEDVAELEGNSEPGQSEDSPTG